MHLLVNHGMLDRQLSELTIQVMENTIDIPSPLRPLPGAIFIQRSIELRAVIKEYGSNGSLDPLLVRLDCPNDHGPLPKPWR